MTHQNICASKVHVKCSYLCANCQMHLSKEHEVEVVDERQEAGLLRQLDHQSNKQLIAQICEGVMKLPTIHRQKHTRDGVQVDAGCLDPADVLDLLENIEKELG